MMFLSLTDQCAHRRKGTKRGNFQNYCLFSNFDGQEARKEEEGQLCRSYVFFSQIFCFIFYLGRWGQKVLPPPLDGFAPPPKKIKKNPWFGPHHPTLFPITPLMTKETLQCVERSLLQHMSTCYNNNNYKYLIYIFIELYSIFLLCYSYFITAKMTLIKSQNHKIIYFYVW